MATIGDGVKPEGTWAFDPAPTRALARDKPGFVMLGNSMAFTRIDPQRLGQTLGATVADHAHPNVRAVHWYLQIKNHVIPAGVKPRAVIVFFRDDALTRVSTFRPDLRAKFSHATEPAIGAATARECVSRSARFRAWVREAVRAVYPLDAYAGSELMAYFAVWIAPEAIVGDDEAYTFWQATNNLFDFDRLKRDRAAAPSVVPDELESDGAFEALARCSLLAPMLDEASQAGLTIVFVRVQRRPTIQGDPPPQSEALIDYLARLRRYVEGRGAHMIDFTGDPAVTRSMYSNGDHIADDHRPAYTDHFARRLQATLAATSTNAVPEH